MARQFLYGQNFFADEFGVQPKVFFLPDTFGYSPQLPQIAKNAEIEYFVTQKLSWSVFNKFPNNTFYWRGLDGTELLTHFPPADTYTANSSVEELMKNVTNHKDKGRSNSTLYLFGEGDGGGGPQFAHVERLLRATDFDGLPKVKFSTCHDFFAEMEKTQNKLMTWDGELYLELHNGTYTTMAEHKLYNRKMELLLRDLEILSCLASISDSDATDDFHSPITEMWRTFLIDQFHDVLPGTCTELTVLDTRQNFQNLKQQSKDLSLKIIRKVIKNENVSRVERIRPEFETLAFDPETERVVFLNTLHFDRFDRVRF